MEFVVLLCWTIVVIVGLPLMLALCIPENFWRWAGMVKRWLRKDLTKKYGEARAKEVLGPPQPYEFFA